MYNLYINKTEGKIEIKPLRKVFQNLSSTITEEVTRYNEVYYFCTKKKPLVEFAEQKKQEWIIELENELIKLKNIQIT
ncbi:hypothetical protein BC351_00570 [Paenibacillus ferrarius]|uniref:Uncharacterized protein n=1 Tax=Paenibacillus ferrarius TaxID=1469647 RepID=A0A1V4HSK8_9BACL|nr:hypothetical protein BC351_00570 [Paenibacillus ferrarius]